MFVNHQVIANGTSSFLGRIADSKSANQSSSILSYLVPIAAALVGCLIGGTAVWLYKKPKHPELSVSYNGDSQCAFENTNFDGGNAISFE